MNEFYLKITMSDAARDRFTAWCEEQQDRGIDPYDPNNNGQHSCGGNSLKSEAGESLRLAWPEAQESLKGLAHEKGGVLAVVLENLPVDRNVENVSSPDDGMPVKAKGFVTELAALALADLMGAYVRVGEDESFPFNLPFHQVVPQKGHEDEIATNRSAGYFPLHNDRIFIQLEQVEFLLLYGIREDEGGRVATSFVPVSELVKEMPSELYLSLFERAFKDPKSETIISALQGKPSELSTVASTLDLAEGWMLPLNERGGEAIRWLQEKDKELSESAQNYKVNISAGVAVISNHKKTLHGRKGFGTSDGDRRRWLQRSHLCLCAKV